MTRDEIARYIDHTILKSSATIKDIKKLCDEAKKYNFAAVCVNPCYVSYCKEQLKNTQVKVATVVGFPLGANKTEIKVFETRQALLDGADEIDMVINIGAMIEGSYEYVEKEIEEIVKVTREYGEDKIVKVIIETSELTDEQKKIACEISKKSGAHFVKTSTGFSKWGAKAEDVNFMKETVGEKVKVKASGGIKTYEDAIKMIEAGADRIGTSNGVAIVEGAEG
ncbi:deoxyribose-phosphate aldolase [Caldicellulosiruptoraceae bacterium PP1]